MGARARSVGAFSSRALRSRCLLAAHILIFLLLVAGQDSGGAEEKQDVREKEAAQLARAEAALERWFGFSKLRGQQANVIRELLGGRDAFGVMPTGAGKSICYQVRDWKRKTSEPTNMPHIERDASTHTVRPCNCARLQSLLLLYHSQPWI
jgi:hypothetical protein